jgi:hypothetical protein
MFIAKDLLSLLKYVTVILVTFGHSPAHASEQKNQDDLILSEKAPSLQPIQKEQITFEEALQEIPLRESPSLELDSQLEKEGRKLIQGLDLTLWGIGLFAGDEPISAIIRRLTRSPWSHVGLILADQNKSLYCFESTGSLGQIVQKKSLPQVQIHKWEDVLEDYDGMVATRKFIFTEGKQPDTKLVTQTVDKLLGTPYQSGVEALINCITRDNQQEDPTTLFCSELTAKCLIDWGCLSREGRIADNYMPKDFSQKEFIPLIGAKLSAERIEKGKKKGFCGCCTIL